MWIGILTAFLFTALAIGVIMLWAHVFDENEDGIAAEVLSISRAGYGHHIVIRFANSKIQHYRKDILQWKLYPQGTPLGHLGPDYAMQKFLDRYVQQYQWAGEHGQA